MEELKELQSLMSHFQSKKPLLTTPVKKPTTIVSGPDVTTPARSDSNTRIRNRNMALSISDVRRKAAQMRKTSFVGSDPLNLGQQKVSGFNGSGSRKPISVLAEKYQVLCDFFDAMVNSIRLLRLKGVPATLAKLSRNIESLTDRRFTLHHLGQLKYILPEVIVAKKIRVMDDKSKCMQEDILLSMEMNAVEIDKEKVGDGFSQLKKIFRTRVVEFSKTHLDDDIPEGELPHLFHQPKQESELNPTNTSTPLVTSLIAPFKRRFSSKSQIKEPALSETNEGSFNSSAIEKDESLLCPASTPSKQAPIPQKLALTPSEVVSTPVRLMTTTPSLCTPKRALSSDNDSFDFDNKSAKRSRSLKFGEDQLSKVDEEENIRLSHESTIAKDDVLAVLPGNLLQSLIEKEKKMMEEKDPNVLNSRRRQQMMAGVPKLFDMIRLLFQSIRRNVVTKDELIFKLLSGHTDIIDRVEIEEQLKLLQELAPEYISEQISLSGDTLISLNKYSCAESIRAKLLEAN